MDREGKNSSVLFWQETFFEMSLHFSFKKSKFLILIKWQILIKSNKDQTQIPCDCGVQIDTDVNINFDLRDSTINCIDQLSPIEYVRVYGTHVGLSQTDIH